MASRSIDWSRNNEESQLRKQGMPIVGKSYCWKDRPPRLLPDEMGEASSLPMWKKVTFVFAHTTISVIVDDTRLPVAA